MMLMPANHSSPITHFIAGRYPGRIGWLVGPSATTKTKPRDWMPFALDNDAYSAWVKGTEWSESAWLDMLEWADGSGYEPRWSIVPDVVANKEATIAKYAKYVGVVQARGFPVAFAVQDGMVARDVPSDAEVVFVGGSKKWKWDTVEMWAKSFPRVHVGRVNGAKNLWRCEELRVESVDGTGWFRDEGDPTKMPVIMDWLKRGASTLDKIPDRLPMYCPDFEEDGAP